MLATTTPPATPLLTGSTRMTNCDPTVGCGRQIEAVAALKAKFPDLVLVGSAYTYFQDYLPHVAQWAVREGWTDTVGLGRMVLSYPTLPLDTLRDGQMQKKLICRTFSDCTTAPRNGIISGCYPLDAHYKKSPEFKQLATFLAGSRYPLGPEIVFWENESKLVKAGTNTEIKAW